MGVHITSRLGRTEQKAWSWTEEESAGGPGTGFLEVDMEDMTTGVDGQSHPGGECITTRMLGKETQE